jgi:hypothetical protein
MASQRMNMPLSDLPPTRREVAEELRRLIAGDLTREAASDWASPWLSRFTEIDDKKVTRALACLGAADLPSTDREYLYEKIDFEHWLLELNGERG